MDDATRAVIERLERRVAELEAENQRLRDRVAELERAAARQAAPFRRPEKKKIPESQKKTLGRPAGHAGACRPVPSQVDAEVEVPLPKCPQCQGPVQNVQRVEQYIEEIPPIRPQVTKVVTYCGTCSQCGEVRSLHPLQTSTAEGAAKVHQRLLKQRDHLLGCLEEPAAETTNNRAERALRPAVIARKLSCGNKTRAGKRAWEILTSLAVTCGQRAENFVDYLATRLPLAAAAAG